MTFEQLLTVNECERCVSPVQNTALCPACTGSKSIYDDRSTVSTIVDLLIEVEENQLFTTV